MASQNFAGKFVLSVGNKKFVMDQAAYERITQQNQRSTVLPHTPAVRPVVSSSVSVKPSTPVSQSSNRMPVTPVASLPTSSSTQVSFFSLCVHNFILQ